MGASRVYRCGTPFNGSELADLGWEQTADTLYLAHLGHAPGKLVRTDHARWSYQPVTFGPTLASPATCSAVASVPNQDQANNGNGYFPELQTYCVTAIDDNSGMESRASPQSAVTNDLSLVRNSNAIQWSAVNGATRYKIYKAINSQFFGYIGTSKNLYFTDDNISPALNQAPPQGFNPFAAAGDWPSTVTMFEQRSVWARSTNTPHGIWTSRSGEIENMDRSLPLRADDAMTFAIMSGQVNAVNQLVPTTALLALTSNAVFRIDGDGKGGVLDATLPPAARRQIGRGGARVKPLLVDNVVFYVPQTGSDIRVIIYDYLADGLKASDISIYSPHLFEGHHIVSWCHAQEPRSLIWAVRDDGVLLCFTWEQEQQVWGWTVCPTDGDVLSVCAIAENGEDRVYLLIERQVAGVTRRFIERMAPQVWTDVAHCCFVDCAVSASFDVPQSSFNGLWHLEGRTNVAGLVDGVAVSGLTVTNGTLVLPAGINGGKVVTFGIPYAVDVQTLPLRLTLPESGSTLGRTQGVAKAVLLVKDTRQIAAGIDAGHLFEVKSRTVESWGKPDDLMNGAYPINVDHPVADACQILVHQDAPLPFTVLAVAVDPVLGA